MRPFFKLILVIFFAACNKQQIQPEIDYSLYFGSDSISSKVDVLPYEECTKDSPDRPILRLRISTEEKFECTNFGIGISEFITEDNLILRFDSIKRNEGRCFPATTPAYAVIDISEKSKLLVLINGSNVDKYKLDITKEKVVINEIDTNFTNFIRTEFFRYPENTFVYECHIDTNELRIYYDFDTILENNLRIENFHFDGDENIPYATDYWASGKRRVLTKYYKYENDSEFLKAGDLLFSFVKENKINETSNTRIILESWNHKLFWSWTMTD